MDPKINDLSKGIVICEGAVRNNHSSNINEIKIYTKGNVGKLKLYTLEDLLDENKNETPYISYQVNKRDNTVTIDRYELVEVKEFNVGVEKTDLDGINSIKISFVNPIGMNSIRFFKFIYEVDLKHSGKIIRRLDFDIYPNSSFDYICDDKVFRNHLMDNLMSINTYHLWIPIPKSYAIIKDEYDIHRDENGQSMFIMCNNIEDKKLHIKLKYIRNYLFPIYKHRHSLISSAALVFSIINLLLTRVKY